MEIGFGGFVNIIDALDGIRMCLPNAIKDRDSHLDLPKGCQTLSGTEALGYVRMRKADPRGDLGRVERQREMLAAVAKKAASPATVLNPVRYWNFCMATAEAIKLGRDTSLPETLWLALAMKQVSGDNGLTLTVPMSSTVHHAVGRRLGPEHTSMLRIAPRYLWLAKYAKYKPPFLGTARQTFVAWDVSESAIIEC